MKNLKLGAGIVSLDPFKKKKALGGIAARGIRPPRPPGGAGTTA